eukprot:2885209-Ditylum_brightwellii.AAC.1
MQDQIQLEIVNDSASDEYFEAYVTAQPDYIWQLLGKLDAEAIDADYWVTAINKGEVTIATDGSVTDKTCYFAT